MKMFALFIYLPFFRLDRATLLLPHLSATVQRKKINKEVQNFEEALKWAKGVKFDGCHFMLGARDKKSPPTKVTPKQDV